MHSGALLFLGSVPALYRQWCMVSGLFALLPAG
jgi:hypothetical protein